MSIKSSNHTQKFMIKVCSCPEGGEMEGNTQHLTPDIFPLHLPPPLLSLSLHTRPSGIPACFSDLQLAISSRK
ncbi:hypothetical protein E2C01_090702 [Portunus trituberculatus]|uniref:Uncharacterized protein n=1 Tax=Portunus trituberculatus TaxID=210409 RepID=A0A5B7JR35_PORTR|nr:hypothetical protein [Portunus trituberculatus]